MDNPVFVIDFQRMVCRQGDPGSTRYFLSLEDNLFRIFGGDRIKGLMNAFGVADLPIESKMLTKSLNESQRKVCAMFTLHIGNTHKLSRCWQASIAQKLSSLEKVIVPKSPTP